MAQTIIMPQLGETVAEGKILEWFKAIGDDIKIGDRLFEVETDKVTVEVEAIAAGKLLVIYTGNGSTAKVGATVAVIGEDAVQPKTATVLAIAAVPKGFSAFEEVKTPTANFGSAKGPDGIRITPLARRLISERGIDVTALSREAAAKGLTKIEEKDVLAFTPSSPEPSSFAPAPATIVGGDVITLNNIRQRTGEKLAENWRTIPHVFQAIDVDFTEIEVVRARHKERFKAETGTSLTYLPFIARAVCIALQAFPL
jgi:pyruvate/2-oxoglutarate dehydrogenase complex dihydrolipoamide acyltransferase (E2) component